MIGTAKSLRTFLDASPLAALVEVTEAKGSTPREKGARMLVSPTAIFDTIGGGQLEFMAIDRAREMLGSLPSHVRGESARSAGVGVTEEGTLPSPPQPRLAGFASPNLLTDPPRKGEGRVILDIALGPEIGQCCGGRVQVSIRPADASLRADLIAAAEAEDAARPHVYIFGGGHVGHALASAFSLLPVRTIMVETRADALDGMPEGTETRLTPVPEEMVRTAPAGSAFVVLTYDHALDFLIVAEALKRVDAAYVGMIGSKTKKATFRSWYLKTAGGNEADLSRLVSPIGGAAVNDKRPAIIAALAAAEMIMALAKARSRDTI